MAARILRPTSKESTDAAIQEAAALLREGGLVAFPTETVYGIGARADHPQAIQKLRLMKQRDPSIPFTLHLAMRSEVENYVPDLTPIGRRLVAKAMPGPITLILDASSEANVLHQNNLDQIVRESVYHQGTVGVRCPDDEIAFGILRGADGPVVATSANRRGNPPLVEGRPVEEMFLDDVDAILSIERTRYGKASTIVKVGGGGYTIVREGVLEARTIARLATLRILFVCTGNTCRSPMAAALARRAIAKRLGCSEGDLLKAGVFVESAGTMGGWGRAADHAQAVMAKRGLDLSSHQSRPLSVELIHQSDYIFVMGRAHMDFVLRSVPGAESRVRLLLGDRDLEDPVGGSEEDYVACADRIEAVLDDVLSEVAV